MKRTTFLRRAAAAALAMMMLMAGCGKQEAAVGAESAASPSSFGIIPEGSTPETADTASPSEASSSVGFSAHEPDSNGSAADALQTKWSSLQGRTLRVGADGTEPGWTQDDGSGVLSGMEVDLLTDFCDYYGMTLSWTTGDSSSLWGMLEAGELDTISGHTGVDVDRLSLYWFTDVYAWDSYAIVSPAADGVPEDGSLSFWDGKVIAADASASITLEDMIAQEAENGVAIRSMLVDSPAGLLPAVSEGEADGALLFASLCPRLLAENGMADTMHVQDAQWEAVPLTFAFPRKEENKDVLLAFHDFIGKMREDGSLAALSNTWFDADLTQIPDGESGYVAVTGADAWQADE